MSQLKRKKDPKKKALGRGLSALIPRQSLDASQRAGSPDYFVCAIQDIKPCVTQPRKRFDPEALRDLAASIKESGLIQPLVVRRVERDDAQVYELIAGERRWRASQMAGLTEVPVVLKEVSDAIAFALALIENIQRQDLNPVEEALAYRRLVEEFDFKQAELAEQVGKSRAAVSNAMRLLQLPEDVLEMLAVGDLSAGHARALLPISASLASRLAVTIQQDALTVRDVERRVRELKKNGHAAQQIDPAPEATAAPEPRAQPDSSESRLADDHDLAQVSLKAPALSSPSSSWREDDITRQITSHLGSSLGARVHLRDQHGRGRLEIHYEGYDALKRLLEALDLDSSVL